MNNNKKNNDEQAACFAWHCLELGDTYLLKMDKRSKGAQSNFDHFISILNKKEGAKRSPIEYYLYKLAGMCNQYGIEEERTYQLIRQKFKDSIAVRAEYLQPSEFDSRAKFLINDAYARFASNLNSYHIEQGYDPETPTLPEEVYEALPPMLKTLARYFERGRERDVFLLSALGVLSSCFPDVQGIYNNNMVGMNLFLFISAPASAGKGVMGWARRLGVEMHKDCESRYRQALTEYEADSDVYKDAIKEGKETNVPVKPERQLFFIPANTSASKIVQTLKANGNFGVMLDTEADTLSQAIGKEWGGFSDTLRKAFHHEPIELQRKINDEYVSIERSFLSVVLSGTPDQIRNLLSSVENGFFSRFIFYDFPLSLVWKNVFDRTKEYPDGDFISWSIKLQQYAVRISQKAREIGDVISFELTPDQEERFIVWFSLKQEELHDLYGDQIIASVRRLGLITFRLAMILTVVRSMNLAIPSRFTCTESDFKTALKLTDVLLVHTTKIYSQLHRQLQAKSATGRKAMFLEKLPDAFNRATAMETAERLSVKEKTAENYLSGYIQEGLLIRVAHNNYQKL